MKSVKKGYITPTILVLSGLGMSSVWLRQSNYGVGLSPDPVHLISIVDHLTNGQGLVAWDGRGFNPVFPFTVSVITSSLVITDVFSASAYLNIIAFGLSILISIVWLSDKITCRIFIVFGGIACAISPLLGNIHASVLTEPMLILFVVISLFALDKFLESNKVYWIILSAVSTALSILTRHMGISLVISALIFLVLRNQRPLQKVKYAFIYLTITMPIIGVYTLRNFLRYERLTERQWASGFSHSHSIDTLTSELTGWIFTNIGFDYLETVAEDFDINHISIGIGILIILIALFGYNLAHFQRKSRLSEFGKLATPIVFILVYILILYFSLRISNIGSISPRYLSPIYIPTIIVIMVILDKVVNQTSARYTLPFIGFTSAWLALLAVANFNAIKQWRDYGYDRNYYSSKDWVDSETISYLKSNPVIGQIHSNNIRAVYAHMRIPNDVEAYFVVLPSYLPEEPLHWDWSRANNIDMYIIWFYGWKAYKAVPLDYDLRSLIASQNLQIVAVLEDGIILKDDQGLWDGLTLPERRVLEDSMILKDSQGYLLSFEVLRAAILKDAQLVNTNSVVDMYLDGERLIYMSTLCYSTDIESPFFLHIYPGNRADRRNSDLDFNNYDFSFSREGIFWGEGCAVIRNLPDYDIGTIRTGQFTANKGEFWMEEFRPELLYQQRISR